MISIIITGGLGNQMFQYALLMVLRERRFEVEADISYFDFFQMHNGYELERVFGIKENVKNKQGLHIMWLRLLNKFRPNRLYMFDSNLYDSHVITAPKRYMFGYWQHEEYFVEIKNKVRELFRFQGIDEYNCNIADEMQNVTSISLHIRRGDYAAFGMSIIGEEYYRKAVEFIKNKVSKPIFYIFSDDINESENMAKQLGIEYRLMQHNRGEYSYKDMFLMSQCKHNIIANSSFSWWGAWLNTNVEKMVIAPSIWDAKKLDFHPQCDSWILL